MGHYYFTLPLGPSNNRGSPGIPETSKRKTQGTCRDTGSKGNKDVKGEKIMNCGPTDKKREAKEGNLYLSVPFMKPGENE